MTITSVNSATFIADLVNFLRDQLKTNITDVSSRVYTSYPKVNVIYPMITVVDLGTRQQARLGMQSEGTILRLGVEIRIWARNVKERDEIFDSVYDYLRNNQLDAGTGLVASNLSGFSLTSAINISEAGEAGIKSKIMEVRFMFING